MLSRRQFIHTGILGAVALGVAGRLARSHAAPGFAAKLDDHVLISALARGMLGQLPASKQLALAENVINAINGLPLAVQAELRQLFDLLQQPLARRVLAGVAAPWADAEAATITAFLQRWRFSRLTLLRSAYLGLHGLLYAAWYGDEASWAAIDYQRPAVMKGLIR